MCVCVCVFSRLDSLTMRSRMKMICSLVMITTFMLLPRFQAVTNSERPRGSGQLPPVVLDPEELLHGVIPCTCIDIRLCPSLLNALKHPISSSSVEIRHLQRFTCGFQGFTPYVCCNEMANTPMLGSDPLTRPLDQDDRATTPRSRSFVPTVGAYPGTSPPEDMAPTYRPQHDHQTSTNGQRYDPTEDIAQTFGPVPSTTTVPHGRRDQTEVYDPPAVTSQRYDPTEDIAQTFGPVPSTTTSDFHSNDPTGIPSTTTHQRDLDAIDHTDHVDVDVNNPSTSVPRYDPNNIPSTIRPIYDPNNIPSTIRPIYDPNNIPSTIRPIYDPNNIPSTIRPIYDPTNIPSTIRPQNDPTDAPHPEEPPPYDPTSDIAETFGSRHFDASSTPETFPRNQTQFQFHMWTRDPSSNLTFHFNHFPAVTSPSLHPLYPSQTSLPPPMTVTYNLLVKTNMEKKYVEYKDLFYKNMKHLKKRPNNWDDLPAVSDVRTPRSTSTRRYVRDYDTSDYYNFHHEIHHPHFFTRHSQAVTRAYYSPPYQQYPSYYGSGTNLRPTAIYPMADYPNDYPEPAPVSEKSTEPTRDDIAHAWDRERMPASTRDESAIVFPDDEDDDEDQTQPYQQIPPHGGSNPFNNYWYHNVHHPHRPHHADTIPKHHIRNTDNPWGYRPPHHGHTRPIEETTPEVLTTPPATTPPPLEPPPTTLPPLEPPPTTMTSEESSSAPLISTTIDVEIVPSLDGRLAKRQLLEGTCGNAVQERIVGGRAATLGAYPWMARIGYLRPGSSGIFYKCAGTLINSLYVVTAAHCVTNLPNRMTIVSVRLGELDETTDPDCNGGECADPVQNYTPANVSVHPAYDMPKFRNDIGLIRLDRPVNITSYISPICLPFDALSSKDFSGLRAVVAGWGASNIGTSSANPVLQWVPITVATLSQCASTYLTRAGVAVSRGQLCAGGEKGRDSCEGDSGGPLMRPEQPVGDEPPRYYIIGIVSFGAKRCGSDNMPGVYTDVAVYLDWMLDAIRA